MVPNYLGVHIGGDPFHKQWNGQMKSWYINVGEGAWVDGADLSSLWNKPSG